MIGNLKGTVDILTENKVILNVQGVGYEVFISNKIYKSLSNSAFVNKDIVSLRIKTVVKENSIELYGFTSEVELACFDVLREVKGVGNKFAIKILGHLTVEEIFYAIELSEKDRFTIIAGIGPKLASRIITELKGRIKKLKELSYISKMPETKNTIIGDAISALENLGYKKNKIIPILDKYLKMSSDVNLEFLITNFLKDTNK